MARGSHVREASRGRISLDQCFTLTHHDERFGRSLAATSEGDSDEIGLRAEELVPSVVIFVSRLEHAERIIQRHFYAHYAERARAPPPAYRLVDGASEGDETVHLLPLDDARVVRDSQGFLVFVGHDELRDVLPQERGIAVTVVDRKLQELRLVVDHRLEVAREPVCIFLRHVDVHELRRADRREKNFRLSYPAPIVGAA